MQGSALRVTVSTQALQALARRINCAGADALWRWSVARSRRLGRYDCLVPIALTQLLDRRDRNKAHATEL
jgi:hypothetical protein